MQTTAELILSQSQPSEYNDNESDTEYDYIE
jgi:hypothetical protein